MISGTTSVNTYRSRLLVVTKTICVVPPVGCSYRPYVIPNVKRTVDGSPDTMPPFWVAKKTASMERKYSEALCHLTASTRPAGKLIRFSEH